MDQLKEQFKKVISYSQGIDNPKVDKIFEKWAENKKRFIEKWNGELQVSLGKVCFHLDPVSRESKFINYCYYLWDVLENPDLANFVEANYSGFYDNTVVSDKYTVPKGMKLLRAFKYFEKDKDRLRRAQDEASRVIQEDKVEGELMLSVHPLDYLSSSENTYNWRSCHALDGDYRAGTISYMMDNSTVVCYLKGADDVKLPRFPESVKWNSKKWRVLLHFDCRDEMCFAGRQYPFSSTEGINLVAKNLHMIVGNKNEWTEWQRDICRDDYDVNYMPANSYFSETTRLNAFIWNAPHSSHYDDLQESSVYIPIYAIHNTKLYDTYPKFEIGGQVPCLECENDYVDETMKCYVCENSSHCHCDLCGKTILEDEGYYMSNGDILCEHCVYDQAYFCDRCGEWHYLDVPHKILDDGAYECLDED